MPEEIEHFVTQMKKLGIKPEMEIYSHSMLRDVENVIKKGLVERPYYINIVLGMMYQGAVEATPKYLQSMLDFLPEEAMFNVTAVGAAQLPLTTMAMNPWRVSQGWNGGQPLLPKG